MNLSYFSALALCGLLSFSVTVDAAPSASLNAPKTALSTTKPAPAAKPATDNDAKDKTFPSQSSVAAKTAFQTLPASDKSLAAALDAKALAAAAKLAGKPGSFQGTVTSVYSPKNHGFVALDFAAHYRDALTANIVPADYAKFPDLSQLAGKHIIVSGKFVAHGDQTQLAVSSPDQIKIVP
jgi:hypothetical protein